MSQSVCSKMLLCDSAVCFVQGIIYGPTFVVVGLPLNMAALWLLLFGIRRWTESTVYLNSLIINDSLLIFSLPFKKYTYEHIMWLRWSTSWPNNRTEEPGIIDPLRDFVHISTCVRSVNCLMDGVCYYLIQKELTARQERRRLSTTGNIVGRPGEMNQLQPMGNV